MLRAVTQAHAARDHGDAAFTARTARFEAASAALRGLLASLVAHAEAAATARVATADLAASLRAFDALRSGGAATTAAATAAAAAAAADPFRAVAGGVAGADVCASAMGSRMGSEVKLEVEALVEGLKGVRGAVKRRGVEAAAVVRWQRKVAAARAGGGGGGVKAAKKLAEYERQLREMRGRFEMAHADAVNRMDNIDRNLAAMLAAPLTALVEISAEGFGGMARAYVDAAERNMPGRSSLSLRSSGSQDVSNGAGGSLGGGSVGRRARSVEAGGVGGAVASVEVWDDAEFDDFGDGVETFDPARDPAEAGATYLTACGGEGGGGGGDDVVLLCETTSASSDSEYVPFSALDAAGGGSGGNGSEKAEGAERARRGTPPGANDAASSSASRRRRKPRTPVPRLDVEDTPVLRRLRALHAFTAQEANELSFAAGDVVEVVATDDSGWWSGALPGGRVGFFPTVYCAEMSQEEELEFITRRRRGRGSGGGGGSRESRGSGESGAGEEQQRMPGRFLSEMVGVEAADTTKVVRRVSAMSAVSPEPSGSRSPGAVRVGSEWEPC